MYDVTRLKWCYAVPPTFRHGHDMDFFLIRNSLTTLHPCRREEEEEEDASLGRTMPFSTFCVHLRFSVFSCFCALLDGVDLPREFLVFAS